MVSYPADRGFDDSYLGVPPWDIGRPQREVEALIAAGRFEGPVLDAGCGTGENALAMARQGEAVSHRAGSATEQATLDGKMLAQISYREKRTGL